MAAQMIYPTSPYMPVDKHHAIHTPPPGAHTEGAEHVESPRKSEGMLSKAKRKARNLRDKIKKATGTDSTNNDHEDINRRDQENELRQHAPDEEAELYEDDEEEHDHINPADNQSKYQQLHSIGALENQGGPEVEVDGGVPVTALDATPDIYSKSADDDVSISPYKNDEPPNALQAASTKYHNYVADDTLQLGGEGKTTADISDVNGVRTAEGNNSRGTLAEVKMATSPAGTSRNSATSDMDVAYPEDLVKPNPEFGHSSSATYDQIGVMNEDPFTDRKLGVGHTSEDYLSKGKEDLFEASVPECAELSGYQSSASVPVRADELVYRPVSDPDEGPPPGIVDAVVQAASTGQSIDNTQQDFANDDPSSLDNVKSLPLEQSPHGEAPEPEKNQHESYKVKDEGSSLTSPPGTFDGVTYEPNAATQSYGTGDNRSSAFANGTDYPSTEEKPISDTVDGVENLSLEQSAHGETTESEKNQQESLCKLSSGKLNNVKDVVTTGLPGSDNMSESGPQQSATDGWNSNAVDGAVAMRVDGSDGAPNSQDDEYVDALSKPEVSEDVRKDGDEKDFYDPIDVKDNQFQEGFALDSGDADEDALNSTLPESEIGKLQELQDPVAATLNYGNASSGHTEGGGDGEGNPYFERDDVNVSPTQQQTGGFIQGPNDAVASTFGYGKEPADEVSHRDAGKEQKPEVDIDGSQPQRGELQGLEASKLGYGTAEELPSSPENMHNTPIKATVDVQPRYDDGGEHGGEGKAGYVSSVAGEDADTEGESPQTGVCQGMQNMEPQRGELHGLKASKLGYGTSEELPSSPENMDNTPIEATVHVQPRYDDGGEHGGEGKAGFVSSVAGDDADTESHSPPPQTGVFQGMKNMVASTLGYNGSKGATAETAHDEGPAVSSTETGHMNHDEVPAVSSTETGHMTHDEVPAVSPTETGHMTHDEEPAVSSTEVESHSQQQTGLFQGMKNRVASTFGYTA